MRRWLLRVLGALFVVVLVGALVTWVQVRRVRSHLAVDSPLSIADATAAGRAAERALQARVRAQVESGSGVFRLSGADATLAFQSMLKSRELLGTLRAERKRLLAALAQVPDPLDLLAELQLEAVDLRKIQGDVAFAGDRGTVRLSAPYGSGSKAGKYLNLLVEASGRWHLGEPPTLQLHRLEVGGLDLLGVVPYGTMIRQQVEKRISARTAVIKLGPLVDVTVADGAGVFTLAAGSVLPPPPPPSPGGPGARPAPPSAPATAAPPIPYELPPEEAAPAGEAAPSAR